ncbi:MAG TPA: SOS response-associated peptidase family protein, partial [Caldisericia bacterium]|nr:SOS response-associated peptidase family protein [Caldisericia bacterium]
WKSPDGVELKSCTIITTTPNEMMKPIHDRMPVILSQTNESEWLSQSATRSTLKSLLVPLLDTSKIQLAETSIL